MSATYNPQKRRRWWGYTDIGSIQFPPNPQYIILTDRTTGQLWWLTFTINPNAPDGCGFVSINSTLPCNTNTDRPTSGQNDPRVFPRNNCVVYDPGSEPILTFLDDSTLVRIMIDNGILGVSVESFNKQMGTPQAPPIYIIPQIAGYVNPTVGYNGEIVLLLYNPQAPFYTWQCQQITQTPNPPPYVPQQNFPSQQVDD